MGKMINRKKLGEFFMRRKLNFLSLISVTLISIAVTVICMITGFVRDRLIMLVTISALLVLLCVIQSFRMKSSFRTMKAFKGKRKARQTEE